MKLVGLTGGVACGKTLVADRMEKAGFAVLDTDRIAHQVLEDPRVRARVEKEFGTSDRQALRGIVFGADKRRKELEAILHPEIARVVQNKLARLRERKSPPAVVVLVVPLLFEAGWDKKVDAVVTVVSNEANQIRRLVARDKTTGLLAKKMIASQLACAEKARRADYVIPNDGTIAELYCEIDAVISRLSG